MLLIPPGVRMCRARNDRASVAEPLKSAAIAAQAGRRTRPALAQGVAWAGDGTFANYLCEPRIAKPRARGLSGARLHDAARAQPWRAARDRRHLGALGD